MPNANAAEWILRLVTTSDRASCTAGDLLEEISERGTIWFWSSVLRTACSHVWEDLRLNRWRMAWLAFSGLLRNWILSAGLGLTVIPLWMAISPYHTGPNTTYIPPWGFYTILVAMLTVVPLLVGWDVARRSEGRELAAGLALTSVMAAISALRALGSGGMVRHTQGPYPYEENFLACFAHQPSS